MKYVYKHDLWDGKKEVVAKEGDDAQDYLMKGYKVCLPEGLCILGDTGKVIKTDIVKG